VRSAPSRSSSTPSVRASSTAIVTTWTLCATVSGPQSSRKHVAVDGHGLGLLVPPAIVVRFSPARLSPAHV
jgi:hypothetical protein